MARTGVRITVSQGLQDLPGRLKRAIVISNNAAGLLTVTRCKEQLRAVGANASKTLSDSIEAVDTSAGDKTGTKVGAKAKHGYWVELGRKPGKVPPWRVFKAILQAWAATKGLNLDDTALWFIANKIRERGFAGRFPFKKARDVAAPGIANIVRDQIRKAINGTL